MYYVYVLKSSICEKYYIGQTNDIDKRFAHHNSTRAKWTKRFQPWEMVYNEEHEKRSETMKREKYLKNLNRIRLINLITA